jgi:putative methyltransferase (TIGR04325 family)
MHLEDDVLSFKINLSEVVQDGIPDIVYFGSVLEYLPEPFKVLTDIFSLGVKNILIDRTGFHEGTIDRLTVQNVPPHIYEASYPAWFFSQEKFESFMHNSGYTPKAEWVRKDEYPFRWGSDILSRILLY